MERKHRYLLEVSRALRFQTSLPVKFWSDCVLIATHLINRMPSTVLNGKCSIEVLLKKKPSYTHLRTFGCLCYATKSQFSHKFDSRAHKCIFIGYPFAQKDYRLYDLDSKTVLVSRDVIFHENIFPFASSSIYNGPSSISLPKVDTLSDISFFSESPSPDISFFS